jgi:O-antigen/teichoic acid export membrane protein
MVIFYIGLSNLLDTALGVNPHIIVNSKYYRNLSYFLLIFSACLVISNLLLIPAYGIVGAAIASLVSKFIFNLIKYLFLYQKFKFQPFNYKFLLLILISMVSYYLSTFIPPLSNYILDIVVRSAVIFLLFALPTYFFNISSDINERFNSLLTQLKLR